MSLRGVKSAAKAGRAAVTVASDQGWPIRDGR